MRIMRSLSIVISAVFVLNGCYSTHVQVPKEEDPLKGLKLEQGAVNKEPPPPKNQTEPDMAFIKDMARRSTEQALECDSPDNAGPRSTASVTIEFLASGKSGEVSVAPPHAGTPIGECVKRAYVGVYVTGWAGRSVRVDQEVDFSKKKKK